jgi:hypothetical protein
MFFHKKLYSLAGFEPGSSVSQLVAITAAPRRHRGRVLKVVKPFLGNNFSCAFLLADIDSQKSGGANFF